MPYRTELRCTVVNRAAVHGVLIGAPSARVRSLADGELAIAQGGRINQTVSACEGECIPKESVHCTQGIVCATGPH
jgi:hypothetical protein